jgi:hypothetical protein
MIASDYDCGASGPPAAGTACASSADCCGNPCVPNGAGGFACAAACVARGGKCTAHADCCAGVACQVAPGSTSGFCGGATDGGAPDGGEAGAPDAGPAGCALYGQTCAIPADCCGGVPCTAGHCRAP